MYSCPHCSTPCYSFWRSLFRDRPNVITCPSCGRRARWPARAQVLDVLGLPIIALIVGGSIRILGAMSNIELTRAAELRAIIVLALVMVVATRWLIDTRYPLVADTRTEAELAAPSRLTRILLIVIVVVLLLAMSTRLLK